MTTIVIVDDHAVVRQSLKKLLEFEEDFKVIGEAGEGLEAVRTIEQLRPDIAVIDLMMNGMNGIEVTRQVVKRTPKTGVVMLSMYGSEGYVYEALKAGARGYVLKESTSDQLVKAIREASVGHRYLCPPLSERVIDNYAKKAEASGASSHETLTNREREVLYMASQGLTNVEIANRLFISRRTVEVHRSSMMQKLGLNSQTDLIRYALQHGILPDEANQASDSL
ncbi:MAG: response regulator transcription factor [Dehalococcoidales bacterium]|nr:response regulator transcription factor [Dehalococcoidales bacterium]